MSSLSASEYHDYAEIQAAQARAVLTIHVTSTYTGVCLGCGRPGPCDEQRAARELLAQPDIDPPADPDVDGTVDDLRKAWLAILGATDRAYALLVGVHDRPLTWPDALTECWRALGLVYAGLAESRRLPGATGGSAGEMLAGLWAARSEADRAAVLAASVRGRLAVCQPKAQDRGEGCLRGDSSRPSRRP